MVILGGRSLNTWVFGFITESSAAVDSLRRASRLGGTEIWPSVTTARQHRHRAAAYLATEEWAGSEDAWIVPQRPIP
jgi:hypothetical protein